MTTEISEAVFETHIEEILTSRLDPAAVGEAEAGYGRAIPGGYQHRTSSDYDRRLCLLPGDVTDFLVATQPKEWKKLREHHGDEVRKRFLRRLARQVERRGTLEVLRNGVKDSGVKLRLAFFRPHSGLNEEHQELYAANLFSTVRQLHFSEEGGESLDLVLFLNGLPLFTAELKTALTGQTVTHAVHQYRHDRDPKEPLFAFGRCLAHFAVDTDMVQVTTRLAGKKTRFLPFNRGHDRGAGNPPVPPTREGYRTSYLWREVWAKDSVLNLIQHFIHRVQREEGAAGKGKAEQLQLFPRYHQLDAVRRLAADAREHGAGRQYLIQHSAGSGKSFTIAWLAHWLSVLHDTGDERVFDSIVVITDRKVLDQQLQETIRQFEQTLGVVENIDSTSRQLKKALEAGKTIIVTTLQKFPVIVEEIGELAGRRFAVIVDEAHSSQTGENVKDLKSVLAVDSLEEAEAESGEAGEGEDLEDRIVAEMRKRGRLPNASFFAFTATPKQKTLELFGSRREDGRFEPFSLYSMRQAIEEGFILDVLENYTTYETYWRLLKKVEDDPRYDKAKAQALLKSFVALNEHAVGQKVQIMVDHFKDRVAHRIDGRAKAMLVTRSRLHCVRSALALRKALADAGLPYKSLVAFSGKVQDGGREYTEANMNGIPEARTAAAFEAPEMRFLVVANKFQTGFDQPLLHTMYVDKKLGGVNAVQTLSRLNRTHPAKEETMVLDFANEAEQIRSAFAPYYETTLLSEATDPNLLYDRQQELEDLAVFTEEEVDAFAELYFGGADQAAVYQALDPTVELARQQLDEESMAALRSCLRDYSRLYSFLSQVLTFTDADLEKLYQFARHLRRKLPAPQDALPREVQEQIDMESLRIAKSYEGSASLGHGEGVLDPIAGRPPGSIRDEVLEPLSKIIEELNERFGADLGPEDEITLGRVLDKAEDQESLRVAVQNNPEENARLAFDTVIQEMLQELVETNFKLYKKITDQHGFASHLMARLFDEYRDRIANGRSLEDVLAEIAEGESKRRELKSTLRHNLHTGEHDERITHAAMKTLAAFQNADGGVLYLGVDDDGEIVGLEPDAFKNDDHLLRHLHNVARAALGTAPAARLDARLWTVNGRTLCRVACPPAPRPVYVKFQGEETFYVRTGPASEAMGPREMQAYIEERFPE